MKKPVLAVIEDDEEIRELIQAFFRSKNFQVLPFGEAESFLKAIQEDFLEPSVIITDLNLPKIDGLELLSRLITLGCEAPVILLTASSSSEIAIKAVEAGAYDFVVKPMTFGQLQVSVDRALHFKGIKEENRKLKAAISVHQNPGEIIGKSPGLKQAVDLARRVADTTASIFISGETGTGKEVIAKAVHDLGNRATKPFIAINCSAIPENLLESELFGHAKGAFTGAAEKKIGLFEEAGDGTLFLDEVGDLSLPLQAKLLRTLQEKKIKRIGENQFRPVAARIISATHKDLKAEIKNKNFREDLYFRLRVIPIHLPPLRQRSEDILPLAEHFLRKYSALNQRSLTGFDKSACEFMLRSPWKGNVRELENSIERAVVLASGPGITAADFVLQEWSDQADQEEIALAPPLADPAPIQNTRDLFSVDVSEKVASLEEVCLRYIQFSVGRNHGAKDKTATELGIDRKTLYRKMAGSAEKLAEQTH